MDGATASAVPEGAGVAKVADGTHIVSTNDRANDATVNGSPAAGSPDHAFLPSPEDWRKGGPLGVGAFLELAVSLAEDLKRVHDSGRLRSDVDPTRVAIPQSLAYMAPEETGRMNRAVDRRADLYALGATYYRILTGSPPFSSGDPVDLVHAHLARAPVPPCQVDTAVPPLISAVVLKLLAKMPEARYQTADSLIADLRDAKRRLETTGAIAPFELGLLDLQRQMPLPEHLVGREREVAALKAAFDEARVSGPRLVLVRGVAGIGKSALVSALRTHASDKGARFVQGKAEMGSGNAPLAPLAAALRQLVLGILGEDPDERAAVRERLREALGPSGDVIAELVPELEQLLGAQPPLPALGPLQTGNRFRLTVTAFLSAVASRDRPLVLFVDDLQRADLPSVRLVRSLARTSDLGSVLLVGALRPVAAPHPLAGELGEMETASAGARTIDLGPLGASDVAALCCETLRCSADRGDALGAVAHRKTAGNPFFLMRFLRFLQQSGHLWWNGTEARWDWDLARVEQVRITENVVDLLIDALQRLPEATRAVLQVAACIGDTFSLALLAHLLREPAVVTVNRLWTALREGFVQPLEASLSALETGPRYQFAHDRVQQAVYSLLSEEERAAIHLRVGRGLLEGAGYDERARSLFRAVDQLNLGAHLVSDESERRRLLELNERAATRARGASAYAAGLGYLQRAIALLPPPAWEAHHDLAFALHRDAAECAYFAGDTVTAEELMETAARHAQSRLEKASLCDIRVVACTIRVDYPEAIRHGREALRLFGLDLPDAGTAGAALAEVRAAQASLREHPLGELLFAREMLGPDLLACVRVLSNLFAPTYIARQDLYPFVVTRMVRLSLEHGNTVESSSAYTAYGIILASMTGDYATGHALGRLGVELSRRLGNPVYQCRAIGLFAAFMNHWREPIASSAPLLREAIATGTQSGELQYGNYWGTSLVKNLFHRGVELVQVLAEVERVMERARKHGVRAGIDWQLPCRQAIRCLRGQTRERLGFDDEEFDERAYLASVADNPLATGLYHILGLETAYLLGNHELALKRAAAASPHLVSQRGSPTLVEHNFYTSLARAARCDGATAAEKEAAAADIETSQRTLANWAGNCPENFRHKWLLVEAEVARLRGHPWDAARLYDEAIDGARQQRFVQDEAIAHEAAGRFYRKSGRERIALLYLSSAARAYASWGATAKVRALEEELPALTEGGYASSPHPEPNAAGGLDLLSILRGSETIASEVVLDRLLEKLLEVCLESAGAERGLFFLDGPRGLSLCAGAAVTGPSTVEVLPVSSLTEIPTGPVERVRSTGAALVLPDAMHQGPVASDPYVVKHAVRSLMALPIRRKTRVVGVLYLENNLATSVFSPDRVRVLQLLSSQMAISLEIAQLFEKLTSEIEGRKRAEAVARDATRLRDDFLASASHELRTPLTSLQLVIQGLLRAREGAAAPSADKLALAERQVQRLNALVEQLLDASRVCEGRAALALEAFDMSAQVQRILARMRPEIERSGSSVTLHADSPVHGRWDPSRIDQLVSSLLSNAITFGAGRPIDVAVDQNPRERVGAHPGPRPGGGHPRRAPRDDRRSARACDVRASVRRSRSGLVRRRAHRRGTRGATHGRERA